MNKVTQTKFQEVVNKVISKMETAGTSWTKDWTTHGIQSGSPKNISGRYYNGFNIFHLLTVGFTEGYKDSTWGTFNQFKKANCKIKKGEKGTPIFFWDTFITTEEKIEDRKAIPFVKTFTVFNVAQVEGYKGEVIAESPEEIKATFDNDKNVDLWVKATGLNITHKNQDKAFYMPSKDFIMMPESKQFKTKAGYYSTLFHEMIHATGSDTRLKRVFGRSMKDSKYAMEELVAEFGASFLCISHGIVAEPRIDHAKYINGWIALLKDKPTALMTATSKAFKACEWLQQQAEPKELVA